MQKLYKPARLGLIFVILAVFLTVYVSALYRFQIYETYVPEGDLPPQRTITRTVTLPAARGNIYDRNGVLLASGRPSYNITVDRTALLRDDNRNEVIMELIYAAMDEGVSYNDTFPITLGAPFVYLMEMSSEQERRLDIYLNYFGYEPDVSASELLSLMREHYEIDYATGIVDARLIIGVRYELEVRAIIGTLPQYVFANDVDTDFIAIVEERSLTGVHIETGYVREYHTAYAAHILGYIGLMSPEEYERYRLLGYPMDAIVGKTGAELAFEEELRGVAGEQTIRTSDTGSVIDIDVISEPEPGNHVYLSLDLGLQIASEHALRAQIDLINQTREAERNESFEGEVTDLITGGAVVVTDVRTGEILASATYPTYNPMTLSQDFALLSTDSTNPMMNRATQGRYNPGSTFKMVTAFAALRHGLITRFSEIYDAGRYTRYEDAGYAPACWIYNSSGVTHGTLNVIQALERSCNYFFITLSDRFAGGTRAGAEILAATAREFGLGQSTGLEIPENPGRLATPEWKREALNDSWYSADTLMTGFGQGHNLFTPVQLANYAATIANGGILNRLTILRRIKSADFSELLYTHMPEVLNVIEETDYIEILQEGMLAVARGRSGTARSAFSDYPVRVAAKTGTVQVEGRDLNDAIFVCYAPYANPEIAISIVVEKGGSGSSVMDIARMIFDYYFRAETIVLATPYGLLIP